MVKHHLSTYGVAKAKQHRERGGKQEGKKIGGGEKRRGGNQEGGKRGGGEKRGDENLGDEKRGDENRVYPYVYILDDYLGFD